MGLSRLLFPENNSRLGQVVGGKLHRDFVSGHDTDEVFSHFARNMGENVALPLREHTPLDNSTIEIIVRLKLNQVDLSGFDNYMPAQLSGGMKKRAAIARALAMDPEILFFDEPSAGLDPIIAAGIDELILKLKKAFQITIVVVTHELASAFLIADRMLLIDKGNIVADGTPQELRESQHPRVRQFLDRIPEPELTGEIDYLQMLTDEAPPQH